MKKGLVSGIVMSILLISGISEAIVTKLVIRARSKDAKFVGTKMGGALVVIRDSKTGKVLAEGLTAGGTGDTERIMIEPKTRFGRIADGSAQFETSLDIDEPTLITISVAAPYLYKDNMIESSTQMWLIPGKDLAGEGVIVEVPGFSIDARAPEKVRLVNNRSAIPIEASIVMI